MQNKVTERRLRTDPFFVFSYALAGVMLAIQVFLMVWLEFV